MRTIAEADHGSAERSTDIAADKRELRQQEPPITRVSRTIRNECLLHFYRSNTFYCDARYARTLRGSIAAIGKDRRKALGRVYLLQSSYLTTWWLTRDSEDWKLKYRDVLDEQENALLVEMIQEGKSNALIEGLGCVEVEE